MKDKFQERANTLFTSMKDEEEDKGYAKEIERKIKSLGITKNEDESEQSSLVNEDTKRKYDEEELKKIKTRILEDEKESRRADLLYPTMKDKDEKKEKNLDKIDIKKKEESKEKEPISQLDKLDGKLTGGAADIKNKPKSHNNSSSINEKIGNLNNTEIADSIAGVKKGQPMSIEKAGGGNVNPKFNPMIKNSYSKNCQSSVAVFEARLRGYDIEIDTPKDIEGIEKLEKFKENPNWAYIDPKTGKYPEFTTLDVNNSQECKKILEDNIQIGERYVFSFKFKSNNLEEENIGHIINVWKDEDGELKFYDPQAAIYYNSEYLEKIKFKFNKFGRVDKPQLLRVDDKKFNNKLLNIISKPKNNIN